MPNYICRTCGAEHPEGEQPPERCLICEDDRQYVGWNGQQWTTMVEMAEAGYNNDLREEEPGLLGIGIEPTFAIGQRALLVHTSGGNVLYDCVPYLDDQAVAAIQQRGGVQAICCSHPHFYASMVSWSHALGHVPVYIPEVDRAFITRWDPVIELWDGAPRELAPGVTLVQTGGHFPGSAVLHWAGGAGGSGVLLVGDTITVVPDRRYVSFMYSYPNLIPLTAEAVTRIVESVEPYDFDRIYGGWWGRHVLSEAKESVRRSAARYIEHLGATH